MQLDERYSLETVVIEKRSDVPGEVFDNLIKFKRKHPFSEYFFGYIIKDVTTSLVPNVCLDWYESIEAAVMDYQVQCEENKLPGHSLGNLILAEVPVTVTAENIDDIMVTALEGGINYWCQKVEVVGDYLGEFASEQISRDGELKLYAYDEAFEKQNIYSLTKDMLLKGLKVYISLDNTECLSKAHLGDYGIDCGMIDANSADAIIQYALFGDILFG